MGSRNALKIEETLLNTQIRRLQAVAREHPEDLDTQQTLMQKLQQRSDIKRRINGRRRLPSSVTMKIKSGNALKIEETLLNTQIRRLQAVAREHPEDLDTQQTLMQKLQQRSDIKRRLH